MVDVDQSEREWYHIEKRNLKQYLKQRVITRL